VTYSLVPSRPVAPLLRFAARGWRRLLLHGALAAVGACVPVAVARAQVTADTTMFAVAATTTLYTVQRATGATATVTTGLSFNTSAIARDPVTGRIFYTSTNYGTANQNGRVAYYDPATGTNVVIAAVGNGDNVVRLAFDQAGTLYGIGSNSPTMLYSISTSTGAMTSLGSVKVGSTVGADIGASGDLAVDWNGTLYANATSPSGSGTTLYRVATSPSGGVYVATAVGVITAAIEASLGFGADGQLYSGGSNGTMYSVNKATGAATTVVTGGLAYFDFATTPRFADLSVTGSVGPVPVGDTAQYTITVLNSGPQSANGRITVVDSLPTGFTYAGVTGAGWTCAAVGRRVTCTTPGPLAHGGSSTLTLSAAVGAAVVVGSTTTNVVRVTGSTIDQDQSDNRSTITGTAVANIDFTLVKSHGGSFTVGTDGVYTLTARNVGSKPSVGTLTVVDTMPAGLTYVTGTGASWTCLAAGSSPQVVTCTRATSVAAGTTVTITLTVAVAQAASPSVTNVAQLSGGKMLSPQTASDPTTVLYRAVTVTPPTSAVSQLPSNGTSYTGSFTVTNAGTLADTYTLTAAKAPGTVVSITSVNGVAGTSATISLAVGANLVIPVVYTVANGAATGAIDTLRLQAVSTASATVADTGILVATVVRAGLAITKQLYRSDGTTMITAVDKVTPGDTVQFLVTVAATGNAGSTLVHVTDPLPSGVTYISATGDSPGWTIAQSGGTVTGDLAGTLSTGATRFFWIRVKVL
jgi:uncharacterized repeat protein (TIGR01451 family)